MKKVKLKTAQPTLQVQMLVARALIGRYFSGGSKFEL